MADTKVGTISHYFDKIGVAVVEVLAPIKVGDTIKISGSKGEFTMPIESMQVEHEQVDDAKKGNEVGMKVSQAVEKGDEVYKVS